MNRIRNPCGPHFIRTTFIHHSTQNQTKHEKNRYRRPCSHCSRRAPTHRAATASPALPRPQVWSRPISTRSCKFHLRHRRRDGTHRRDTCVPEVFVRRPRYVEDRSQLVRRLHLPDSRGNRPRIVLLLMEYGMNKGVGRSVEFRGLTSQYLFLFAAGMLASLLLTMVLYMAGPTARSAFSWRWSACRSWSGDVPHEPLLRPSRADETPGGAAASAPHHTPPEHPASDR